MVGEAAEVAIAHWVCKGRVFGGLPGAQSVRHLTRVSVYLVEAALGSLLLLKKQSKSEKNCTGYYCNKGGYYNNN